MPSSLTPYAISILGTLITLTWFAAIFYGLSAYHQHIIEQEQEQREDGSSESESDDDEESMDDELYMDVNGKSVYWHYGSFRWKMGEERNEEDRVRRM
ncbi:MAG: hypothetical protein Q9212_002957, partial [Teloschistes hypoglaucus]